FRAVLKAYRAERHYRMATKGAAVVVTLIPALGALKPGSHGGAWKLLIVTGAGTGGVLLLRWYWWRINAWSEVSAMVCAFVVSLFLQIAVVLDKDRPIDFAHIMIITVAITTVVWLAVTFLNKQEPRETLVGFYRSGTPSRV